MSTLWRREEDGWRSLSPSGYPSEKVLHDLVEEAPSLLPLTNAPRLTVIGREVPLGNGYADLLAVESDGRPVIIEIKLARNSEARRAVIAQVLSYAAELYGSSFDELDRTCSAYLAKRGYDSVASAVGAEDQGGEFDEVRFSHAVEDCLLAGRFRLVIVLDDAPPDLMTIARYLDEVGDRVTVDVLTVHQFYVGEETMIIPERVDLTKPPHPPRSSQIEDVESKGQLLEGSEAFREHVDQLGGDQSKLRHLISWAEQLDLDGLIQLQTYKGRTGRWVLLPRFRDEKVGLVTIWPEAGGSLSVWRSVFERRAERSLLTIERLVAPKLVGQGNTVDVSDELLIALRRAYEEATGSDA